jgi:beta-lactamase regulating signal transducer with metallopeptidase domain
MALESSALFGLLLDSSLRVIAVAASVWAILLVARVRAAGVRHAAWTAVLASMLLMPALPHLVPAIEVPVPAASGVIAPTPDAEFWPVPAPPPSAAETRSVPAGSANAPVATPLVPQVSGGTAAARAASRVTWPIVGGLLYAAGALFFLARLGVGWRMMRRVVKGAKEVEPSEGPKVRGSEGLSFGGSAALLESPLVAAPLTAGILAPRIILPSTWRSWPEEKLRAVLAHELAHVRRRDPLIALVAYLNRALFWFHPLAWWLERTLAAAAEDACDDAAVREVGTARRYAEVLLDMAESVRRRGARVAWQGVGVDGTGLLGQRINRILRGDFFGEVSMARKLVVALGCATAILLVVACRPQQPPPAPPLKPNPEETESRARQRASTEAFNAALQMTAPQVAELESVLQQNPKDLEARKKLMTFYRLAWQKAVTWDDAVAARRRHVLWVIEHHPGDPVTLNNAHINPAYDPAGYAEARKAWLAQASKPGATLDVVSNAAYFLEADDKTLAEHMLLRLQAMDPGGPQPRVKGNTYYPSWSGRLGELYAAAMLGETDRMATGEAFSAVEARSPFAQEARKKLEASTDATMLSAAAQVFILPPRRPEELAGVVDFDPAALAASYLERAITLDPNARNPRILLYRLQRTTRNRALSEKLKGLSREKQADVVLSLPEAERFAVLPGRAESEYEQAGFLEDRKQDQAGAAAARERARKYAADALQLAAKRPGDPECGLAIFSAHTTLGALALHDNDTPLALKHLAEAGNAPPSEGLKYDAAFGWSRLAIGLLKRGERESVAAFLDRYARLNELSREQLTKAAAKIRAGVMPSWYQSVMPTDTAR